ncbi:unnamed protein product [Rotaria sp. Silwood2]|nr:unnamed protein product [Rotaria sp. Silwood2]CAF2538807.1 unnamed protein product [Rotaria sp. Silwood2]CAF2790677.1 unnamed protein product [Rotaria sp. Silwood2]CAF2935646.1 unnamed protein product [Rotaria sp. Silwood2]CAF4238334.1 unnamed protein product [Rotaria sp. Silwood2]
MPAKKEEIIADSKDYFVQVKATVEQLSNDYKKKLKCEMEKNDLEAQLMKAIGLINPSNGINDQIHMINGSIIELNSSINDALKLLDALNYDFGEKEKKLFLF